MFYTVKSFRELYHPNKSLRTVQRMIKSNLVPSNCFVSHGNSESMVFIGTESQYKAYEYNEACYEFHKRKHSHNDTELSLCVELHIKYEIELTKLTKLLGV